MLKNPCFPGIALFLSLAIFSGFGNLAEGTEAACCDRTSGDCNSACRKVSLFALASETSDDDDREELLRPVYSHCPLQMTNFWECMNNTIEAIMEGSKWEGRTCCPLSQTRICQISCLTARRGTDLAEKCRRSDETAVFQCLEKQEEYKNCCSQSRKSQCREACRAYLLLETPNSQNSRRQGIKKRFDSFCEKESNVLACVSNFTYSNPVPNAEKFNHCCSKGRNTECQEACFQIMRKSSTTMSDRALLDALLEKGCGEPRPDDKMWQCFLSRAEPKKSPDSRNSSPSDEKLGMVINAAKLHCCHRGNSPTCRKLCHKTFNREWIGSWNDLDKMCFSSPDEIALRSCIDEVDEPCELGCEGLNFCSAFNNRPSDLFRRCNAPADLAARQQFEHWKELGYIPLSETVKLPLKNLSSCATEKWKAVACTLQLKPCHPKTHASQICRSDCLSLLHECVDFSRLMNGPRDIASICSVFSPPPGDPCISLTPYSKPKTHTSEDFQQGQQITRPCKSRPCNNSVCEVSRNCPMGKCQSSHECKAGCSLGEVSKMTVAPGTWVRVPSQNGNGCQRLCHCNQGGQIEQCIAQICDQKSPCWLGRKPIEHGTQFYLDCNLCSCRSGELICSKRQCAHPPESSGYLFGSSDSGTELSLPCNCPSIHAPVCASNGKTYHSACLAKCGGLTDSDLTEGECIAKDPCESVHCGHGRQCIRMKRICLVPVGRRCPQFQCVPVKCESESWMKSTQVVCDVGGRTHRNLCSLSTSGSMLSYMGPCFQNGECSNKLIVCGIDGETYPSECTAKALSIPVDYYGQCRHVSTADGTEFKEYCSNKGIKCPELPRNCMGITPPGACCPICGGVLRIIYSPSQVLRIAETTDSQVITIEDIRKRLNLLIQTAQCEGGAYLGLGTEIIVVVTPIKNNYKVYSKSFWTKVQMQACISEAERLATLISNQNPVIQVDASLSVLLTASITNVESGASSLLMSSKLIIMSIVSIYIFFTIKR